MPCYFCQASIATESNTWFACESCLEERRRERLRGLSSTVGRTLQGALAESPPKAETETPNHGATAGESRPPGAQPERDPVLDSLESQWVAP